MKISYNPSLVKNIQGLVPDNCDGFISMHLIIKLILYAYSIKNPEFLFTDSIVVVSYLQ